MKENLEDKLENGLYLIGETAVNLLTLGFYFIVFTWVILLSFGVVTAILY